MEAALKAIAEPTRRRILTLVKDEELSAGEIASHFDVSRPAISKHLRILKDARVVRERREGRNRIYELNPAGLNALREYFDRFWAQALDAFKQEVEKSAKKQKEKP